MIDTSSYMPFHWLYPGMYQPLTQTSVLLVDLHRWPTSQEANASRLALEKLFARLGPNGRIFARNSSESHCSLRRSSQAAHIAWSRLEGLRKKVWRDLGIDASVSWGCSFANTPEPYGSSSSVASESSNLHRMHSRPRPESVYLPAPHDFELTERSFPHLSPSSFTDQNAYSVEGQVSPMCTPAQFDDSQSISNDLAEFQTEQDLMLWQIFGEPE